MSTSGPPSPLLSFRGERITSLTRSQSELARPGGSPRESFSGSPVTGSLLQIGSRNSELIASASVRTALGNPIVRAKCRAALCEEIVVDMQVCRRGRIHTKKESSDFDLSPRSKVCCGANDSRRTCQKKHHQSNGGSNSRRRHHEDAIVYVQLV